MASPRSIAVISIPGLPNGFLPLDSTWYHNPGPALKTLTQACEKAWGQAPEVQFQDYVWPREVRHPWGDWNRWVPGFAIPTYYYAYQHDAAFRKRVLEGAMKRLKSALAASPWVFLILHSHGNRIGLDALHALQERQEIPSKSRIFVISQAPAYSGVGFGLVPPGLSASQLKTVTEGLHGGMFVSRIRSDLLSGAPPPFSTPAVYHFHAFPPRWRDVLFGAHGAVRSRPDVLARLKKELVASLSV